MARLEDTEKRHNTHMPGTYSLYHTRMPIPYAYGTENRTVLLFIIIYFYLMLYGEK